MDDNNEYSIEPRKSNAIKYIALIAAALLLVAGGISVGRVTNNKEAAVAADIVRVTPSPKLTEATTPEPKTTLTVSPTPTTTIDNYAGWTDESFTLLDIKYKLPTGWSQIATRTLITDSRKAETIRIVAADGFTLNLNIDNGPRGYEGEPTDEVLQYGDIDALGNKWLITDNSNGKISGIYVSSADTKVGKKILHVGNIGYKGFNVEFGGGYKTEYDSLEAFNQLESVQIAKKIFESIAITR
jgi:hypothetical protein